MAAPTKINPGLRVYSRIHRPDAGILARLANAGVGDVSDSMHGMGVMDPGIRQIYAPMKRIFGPAITVDVSPGDGLLLRAALESAQPGDVIVANSHGATARALLGGAIGMHLAHRGVQGLVVDGAVRDVAEFQALDFPVMARAVTPRSGTSSAGWGEVNVPVACGTAVVEPGDIIIGDVEGLVVVPRRWADQIANTLGNTGHAAFDPGSIRSRLAALAPRAPITGIENLHRAMAERGGTVIDGVYGED